MPEPKPFSNPGIQAAAKYNPHLWGPEELEAIFVVRQMELSLLSEAIKDTKRDHAPQHILLIGQRGMGKTTLLQRMALKVETDEKLRHDWVPLRFPEEQYTVSNLAELWGNVLGALADAIETQGLSTHLIDQNLLRLETLPPEQREQQTLGLINQWCEQNNKRLLLLIDSTDLLFDNLSENKKSKKDGGSLSLWRLRNTLQSNPNLFWLGGSYNALEATDLYHDAFQDFFRLVELKPLKLDEMKQAMCALARTFGTGGGIMGEVAEQKIIKVLNDRPERLQTLRQLTGGNPRTTVMLFELFSTSGGDQVRADIERLLDLLTPLYKARLEALAEQPRKLLAHIMESWQPISLGQLAGVSGLPNTQISSQLVRLEKDGLVTKTELPNTSRAGYQATERFFNIWYLMRNAPRRLKLRLAWLVEFMRLWYSPEELEGIARQRINTHSNGRIKLDDLEYSRVVALTLASNSETRLSLDYHLFKELQRKKQQLRNYFDFDGEDKPFKSAEEYQQRFEALKERLMQNPFNLPDGEKYEFYESFMVSLDFSLDEKEVMTSQQISRQKINELKQVLREEIPGYNETEGKKFNKDFKKIVLSNDLYLDLPDQKIAYYQICHHLIENPHYFWKLTQRYWEKFANDSVDDLIIEGLDQNSGLGWHVRSLIDAGPMIQLRCKTAEVHRAVDIWIDRCSKKNSQVMSYNLGVLLSQYLNRYDEAESAYRKAIELDGNYAPPWNGLGNLLSNHLNRYDEAEFAYRKAIELDDSFASPWNGMGNLLCDHLNRYDEAESAYWKAIELDDRFAYPWNGMGGLLCEHLKRYDEAESVYRKAIELDGYYASPWNGLGDLLKNHLNRYDEAESAYRKAIELDDRHASPWNGLGNLLKNHLNRHEEAESAYQKAIELDSNYAYPWNGLGNLLSDHLNRYDEAESAYLKAIELNDTDPYYHANLARLYASRQKAEPASEHYRFCLEGIKTDSDLNLVLQCHLWLRNTDLANQALTRLAEGASAGDNLMFFEIKEQSWECQQIGRGLALVDLMAGNPYAGFLKPFEMALRKVNGDNETIKGAPLEIRQLAEEIVIEIQKRF